MARRKLAKSSQNRQVNHASLQTLVMDIVDTARKLHPGYVWAAGPSDDGGTTINLICADVGVDSGRGFVFHTADIQQPGSRRRQVTRACGTILQRLGLDRHRHTDARTVTGLKRNAKGDLEMELGHG